MEQTYEEDNIKMVLLFMIVVYCLSVVPDLLGKSFTLVIEKIAL